MARNRKLIINMGLNNVAQFFGTKWKRKDGAGGSQKKPKKNKGDNEEWSSEEDNNESEGEGEGNGNGDGHNEERTSVKTRASMRQEPAAEGTGKGKGKAGAKWAENARKVLEGGDLGPDWENLVELWWRLEGCFKFATSVSVLGRSVRKRRTDIKNRPSLIQR